MKNSIRMEIAINLSHPREDFSMVRSHSLGDGSIFLSADNDKLFIHELYTRECVKNGRHMVTGRDLQRIRGEMFEFLKFFGAKNILFFCKFLNKNRNFEWRVYFDEFFLLFFSY